MSAAPASVAPAAASSPVEEFDGHTIELGSVSILGRDWLTVLIRSRQARMWRRRPNGLYYRFATEAERSAYIAKWKEGRWAKMNARKERLDAKRAARESFINPYKVGDILHSSWGYDQTNVEFFEVVAVRPRALKIRQVEAKTRETGFMSGDTEAVSGRYIRDAVWVTIQVNTWSENGHHVPSPIHGNLYPGAKSHCSWYA